MRVAKKIKRKFIPRRGKKTNYTQLRIGTKTDRGVVGRCEECGLKGAIRLNKVMRMNFVTHHALTKPSGEFKITNYCLASV